MKKILIFKKPKLIINKLPYSLEYIPPSNQRKIFLKRGPIFLREKQFYSLK